MLPCEAIRTRLDNGVAVVAGRLSRIRVDKAGARLGDTSVLLGRGRGAARDEAEGSDRTRPSRSRE